QAQDLYLAERAMLEELRKKCLTPAPAAPMPSVLAPPAPALRPGQAVAYNVTVNGDAYRVTVQELFPQ
ncbi:MAG: hypothetical protein IIV90_02190, partial [Oscillospiraceae bacterium]|nr:hypothetical protein [Oscillospiraceae bacterium]